MWQGNILGTENDVSTLQKQAFSNNSRLNSVIGKTLSEPHDLMESPCLHSVTMEIKFEHWVLEGRHKHIWEAKRRKNQWVYLLLSTYVQEIPRKYTSCSNDKKCFVNASPFLIILILFNMLYFSKVKKIELSDWCRAITINSQAYHLLLSIVLNSVTVKVPLGFKI